MTRIHRWMMSIALLLLALVGAATAHAHFKLNLNVRVVHIVPSEDGLNVYLRLPMSFLVADLAGPIGADTLPIPAPFTTNRLEDGQPMHLVDGAAIRADPAAFGALAADAVRLSAAGTPNLPARLRAVRVSPLGQEPVFATRQEAEQAFAADIPPFPEGPDPTYVGDTVADIHLLYPAVAASEDLAFSFTSNPGLDGQAATANLILDYRTGAPQTYRSAGLLLEPIVLTGSPVRAASTFVVSGIEHILEGPDHLLFVLCLVLGSPALSTLLWRVTGFTLGHSVTLALGFFGYAPRVAWFIPAVETAVALSIIYAAVLVFWPIDAKQGRVRDVSVTAAIGLLHGLGFSFMLREILSVHADNVWQSLLAFNLGVELGQIAIALVVWPSLVLLGRLSLHLQSWTRLGLATAAGCVAAIWVVERATLLEQTL